MFVPTLYGNKQETIIYSAIVFGLEPYLPHPESRQIGQKLGAGCSISFLSQNFWYLRPGVSPVWRGPGGYGRIFLPPVWREVKILRLPMLEEWLFFYGTELNSFYFDKTWSARGKRRWCECLHIRIIIYIYICIM